MNFEDSFERLIGHEGGYVNDPEDPGGETKYGISKRSYPAEDIPNLTLGRALQIYQKDFWGPSGCDAVPDAIRYEMFDCGVNSGPKRAILILQKAVGEIQDGLLGPHTLMAAQSMNPFRLQARLLGHRLDYMNDLKNWAAHGRGWAQRVAEILQRI